MLTVEALICLVVLTGLWRIGSAFIFGPYDQGPLLVDALALMVALVLVGQLLADFFFPSFQESLRRVASQRAKTLVDRVWRRVQIILMEQFEVAKQLRQQGRELLIYIDGVVQSLASPIGSEPRDVKRLFGELGLNTTEREPITIVAEDAGAVQEAGLKKPRFE